MKEEMQGFHMNPISKMFFGEIALFLALSQSKGAAPRTCITSDITIDKKGLRVIS